jgi:hypothetical protein
MQAALLLVSWFQFFLFSVLGLLWRFTNTILGKHSRNLKETASENPCRDNKHRINYI